jgi:hypothetical protein
MTRKTQGSTRFCPFQKRFSPYVRDVFVLAIRRRGRERIKAKARKREA